MKPARLLLITLGGIAVVGAVGLALVLTPAVQRWAVRRAAGSMPGLKLDLASVSAGFSSVSLRGVQLEKGGLRVQLESLESDYSPWQLLFSRRLAIHHLVARGLLVDASRLSPAQAQTAAAGAPGAAAVAPGLMARLHLPFALVLDDARIEGRALLPSAPGKPPVGAEYKITGGKFAPGQEGALLFSATVTNPVPEARVTTLHAQLNLRATQTAQRTFSGVGLSVVVDAEGRSFPEQSQLKIMAELKQDAAGENYAVSVDTLLRGVPENMLAVQGKLPGSQKEFAGEWTLKARTAQLEPFFLGGSLPDFDVRGGGRFTFNPANYGATLQGSLAADVSRLEAIEPAYRAIGPVKLAAQFDLAETEGIGRLHQLTIRIDGGQPVLELSATGAVEFNLKERRLQVGGPVPGEAVNLQLSGVPLAWIRPFVHAADVSGGMITGQFTVTGEAGRLLLRAVLPLHIAQLSIVQEGVLLLAKADVTVNLGAVLTTKELQANITDLTLKTPAGDSFTAQAGVTVPALPDPPITVSASYTADLPKLLAPWLPLGRVKSNGEADFTKAGSTIELRRLNANVSDDSGAALFSAVALRPFSLDLAARRATTGASGPADLARLVLGRLPLECLPLNQPDAKLGGVVAQGEFVLAANGEQLSLRAVSPLRLANLSLTQNGQPALTGLGVEALPVIEVMGRAAAKVQTGDVTVRTATGATLLSFKGEATRSAETGLSGALTFNLEIPALATQPLFAGAQRVSAGRASGEIRAALGAAASQLEARLTVNGLVASEGGQTLPVANLSFRAVAQGDGRLSVQAPLLLDRAGQRSDLNFLLELTPAAGVFGLDGKLTGEHVELADALSVLGVFLASVAPVEATPQPAAAVAKITADTVPAWSRFNGSLLLDVRSVTRGTEWAMTGLNGSVAIERARVSLPKLEAAFGEKGRFAASGEMKFAGGPQPYQLDGNFSLTEFNAGPLFKALEPGKPATVEGVFNVTGRFTGNGETMDRTLERTRGRFELAGRQGIFRGLQRSSNKVSMTSKAVELSAAVLGSIFGSDKVTKAAEKVAGQAYFVDQLAQSVAELNYDQLNVRLVRDESLNMTLEDISLVAPDIRLLGKGAVTYVADKPLLEQPLNASLSFAGRGKIEQLLGKLKLLDGARDELGYAKTAAPITIGGSLAKPDPSAFFSRLATSKLTDFLNPDN
ncbi:MAG TPA: AsmA-like C-terminal region-containing protein [Lacunisphaera sp.]|nr:AsmA-like C-terminal region-containing protein [Lacunisphaera sp.]